ncbi:hypothetical protein EVAR_98898_1 [Eumeta japonica]|uniref:sn-1-specific diacylglycerol lipase ABHD11 n=1 Tax=Eumeta variegata TaxID=151549 RepID=A0A4C1Y680_EUMVA|nr:hypothetical protein EVAR_98898_1 [Eumeta japonica]
MRILLSKRNYKTYYVGPPRKVAVDLCYKFLSNKNVSGPGRKSPIFLLHDLLTSKSNWTSVGEVISAKTKRQVMAVDMRNHGQSPHTESHDYIDLTLDILKLLNKLEIKKATFLGHSIGGRSAMVTALKQPKIVDNLIVVDVSPTAKPIPNTEYLMKILDAMSFVDFKGVTSAIEAINVAEKSLRTIAEDEKALNALLANIGQNPDNTFAWVCNVNALKQYLPSMATFPKELEDCVYTGPTLFVLGEKSDFVQGIIDMRNNEHRVKEFLKNLRFSKTFPSLVFVEIPNGSSLALATILDPPPPSSTPNRPQKR